MRSATVCTTASGEERRGGRRTHLVMGGLGSRTARMVLGLVAAHALVLATLPGPAA